jgi:hypothetical protein
VSLEFQSWCGHLASSRAMFILGKRTFVGQALFFRAVNRPTEAINGFVK